VTATQKKWYRHFTVLISRNDHTNCITGRGEGLRGIETLAAIELAHFGRSGVLRLNYTDELTAI
jgi:hypothetical protein